MSNKEQIYNVRCAYDTKYCIQKIILRHLVAYEAFKRHNDSFLNVLHRIKSGLVVMQRFETSKFDSNNVLGSKTVARKNYN